jgi:hypothetical protein
MLRGWGDLVEGIFEIRRKDRDSLVLLNLLDYLEYRTVNATALARGPGGRARPAASVATAVSGPGREQGGYQAGAGKNGCGVPLAR